MSDPTRPPTEGTLLRKIVVYDEYLDGISSLTARKPEEWDDEYRLVPADVLDAYDAAWEAMRAAEKRLGEAYATARVVKRRRRKSDDE